MVFVLEPHTSHWGQPLDKNPFLAFKDAFNEGMQKFNIKAGYKRTGIWQVNRAAIPSYVTEPSKICKSKVVLVVILLTSIVFIWIVLCLFFS